MYNVYDAYRKAILRWKNLRYSTKDIRCNKKDFEQNLFTEAMQLTYIVLNEIAKEESLSLKVDESQYFLAQKTVSLAEITSLTSVIAQYQWDGLVNVDHPNELLIASQIVAGAILSVITLDGCMFENGYIIKGSLSGKGDEEIEYSYDIESGDLTSAVYALQQHKKHR